LKIGVGARIVCAGVGGTMRRDRGRVKTSRSSSFSLAQPFTAGLEKKGNAGTLLTGNRRVDLRHRAIAKEFY
jgi:hypothetical protein